MKSSYQRSMLEKLQQGTCFHMLLYLQTFEESHYGQSAIPNNIILFATTANPSLTLDVTFENHVQQGYNCLWGVEYNFVDIHLNDPFN